MGTILSDELSRILGYAADEAMRTGFLEICPDHLLLAVIRDGANDASDALAALGIDLLECKHFIESRIARGVMIPYARKEEVGISRDVQNLLNVAMLEASVSGSEKTGTSHLMAALMKICVCEGRTYLMESGLSSASFSSAPGPKVSPRPSAPKVPQFIIQTNNKNIS